MDEQKDNQEIRTNWHRLFGLMFGTILENLGFETIAEYDVSRKAQLVDVVVVRRQILPKIKELAPSYYEGFEELNDHNLISFKSFHEVFNEEALEEFYGHYSMEGISMPYTKETFLKENYPDWHEKILFAKQEGASDMLKSLYGQGIISKKHYDKILTSLTQQGRKIVLEK
jgi:hypothetical protein